MNIIGIGVDIEKIDRFKKIHQKKNNNFLKRIYTKFEIDYCFQQIKVSEKLAEIFSGKEAIIKALSNIGYINTHRNKIELISNNYNVYDDISYNMCYSIVIIIYVIRLVLMCIL